MSLVLHAHPLSSFCWKAIIALYENDTPFELQLIDLGSPTAHAAFLALWPIGKMPVLQDKARGRTIPETSIIIEYLALHYSGKQALMPSDPESALQVRLWDRFYDLYVSMPMQRIVEERLRPADGKDPHGLAAAKARLATAYDVLEREMVNKAWAAGESFTMADCAALPGLFYANKVQPFASSHPALMRYLERLSQRPSIARVLEEAKPYFHMFPQEG
jgi:glutathione S-transferase